MFLFAIAAAEPTEEVVVEQEAPPQSAAERTLDADDVLATPGRSTDELLRSTRGLHQSAHGGHGKAFQYFLRGFDAVHGADLAIDLEGIPLNEVSNVHGHGYLDLHFLPRGLVLDATLTPGISHGRTGDFGVAGTGSLGLGLARPGLQFSLGAGTDTSGAFSLAFRPEGRGPGTFAWIDAVAGQGVGDARSWDQTRAGVGIDGAVGIFDVRTFALVYHGRFDSPGVLLEQDLESDRVDFYDAYPGSGGGTSSRILWGARAEVGQGPWHGEASLWTSWRSLSLRQNFTGAYTHPVEGDATLQSHEAASAGLTAAGSFRPRGSLALEFGIDGRFDAIQQAEAAIDLQEEIWEERIDAGVGQRSAGAWAAVPFNPRPWLEIEAGARVQTFGIRVDRTLDGGLGSGVAKANAPVVAPRAHARVGDGPVLLLLSGGRGFRSPEARGVENGRAPVSTSNGGEVSGLLNTRHLDLRAGAFGTWISNEIVFDHAAARFLTTGSTRRLGAYGGLTLRPLNSVVVELDVTLSDGRYSAGDPIPYAPRVLVVGSVRTNDVVTGPLTWTTGVRSVWLGQRHLPGGYASHASFVTDLTARCSWRDLFADVDIDNVFASRWRDGEFFYASDWGSTDRVSALPRRHITAGAPFVARLSVGARL